EARVQFEVLLEQSPHDSEIVLSLALITMENAMEPEAEQYFMQLLSLGQRKNTANYYLGRLKEKQQQYGAARDYYQAVGQGKEFMAAQVALAQMLARQGKLNEALVLIDEAKTRNPARVESLYLLEGELLVNDGQLKKALGLFDKAIKSSPKSVNLLYSRAMLQEKLDNLPALENDLRKILEIKPENVAALNALGYTLADRTDRYREAEKLILKAYSFNQDDPAILDSMGWVQYRLGNYESAVKYLRMAYDKFPDAEIAAHLGEVIWVMGNREEARSLWGQALKNSPDSWILKDTMDRFEKQGLKPILPTSPTSGVPSEAVSQVK
ncbi:MAG: tetratricopeptide repeat protein, partial [Endozoicomonas sp.]